MPDSSVPEALTFQQLIHRLAQEPGVVHAVLAAPDGLLIAGPDDELTELWAAVSAVLGNLGNKVVAGLDGGELQAAVFAAPHCQFVVKRVSVGYVLAVAQPTADVEGLWTRVEATAQQLEEVAGQLALVAFAGASIHA